MYFSNSDGAVWLEEQCQGCVHYEGCAVYGIQTLYNYDQMKEGQEKLREVMGLLIDKDGCKMRYVPDALPRDDDAVLLAAANLQRARRRTPACAGEETP